MSAFRISPFRVLWFLALLGALMSQSIVYKLQPDSSYSQPVASAQACYANCQSCQTGTNQCEECFAPYFVKTQDGSCQIADHYTIESSANELREGTAFQYTPQSWGTQTQTDCSPDPQFLSAPLRVIGPFSAGTTVNYRRTLSFHQYIVVRFLLIATSWEPTSILTMTLTDENNRTLTRNVTYAANVPKESLCSPGRNDQRFSVQFQIEDRKATEFNMQFKLSGGKGSWSVATWLMMTGFCDASCMNCTFSRDPVQCIGCNEFFIKGSDQKCSQCYTGFKLATVGGVNYCQKCSIEFQTCTPGQEMCFYPGLSEQLDTDCKFTSDSDYSSVLDINQDIFPGSLFTVNGRPALSVCGKYSMVGLAQRGDSITRMFATLQSHLFVSITFNIFIVDQWERTRSNLVVILLDGKVLEASYVTTQIVSDICTNDSLEAFVTYPATRYYAHTKTENVNLTITSNSTNWGIRNLRLAFQVCDSSCLGCSKNGCIQCPGYFQISNLKCEQCPAGYGSLAANSTCVQCPQDCIVCSASLGSTQCLECSKPFFLFEGVCRKRANIGDTLKVGDGGPVWQQTPLTNVSNSTNSTCSINLPSRTNGTVGFTVSEDKMTSHIQINQPHFKKIVEFYLLKIDKWDETDHLEVYLNDLLVLSRNYSGFGNDVCFDAATDTLSFESIEFEDSNSSLSVSFQVSGVKGRRFGVGAFRVYPLGCVECQNYGFNYKIDYSYDQFLNVRVNFNRVYNCNNATLFTSIFQLLLDSQPLPYSVVWNNSVTYILEAEPGRDILVGNLTLLCLYPQLVTADLTLTVNSDPFFSRLLQADYSKSKVIDNNSTQSTIARYTPVENAKAIDGIRIFFEVVSRIVIYVGLALLLIGCPTICTHFMHNMQKLWLHIFLASLAVPSLLKFSLIGFRQTQNQNIAIYPTSWEAALPKELYYQTPADYQHYYTDVGFFRNIYNIGIAFAGLILFGVLMHVLLKKSEDWDLSRNLTSSLMYRHLKVTFHKRPFFLFNSLVFYQYLTLILACCLQFLSLTNGTNQGAFGSLNAAGAVVAFILGTAYPIIHFLYLRRKYLAMMPSMKIEYTNRYHEVFFRFLPEKIWVDEEVNIGYAERMYSVIRFGQLWWYCIVAVSLHGSPQAQCFLLMITNFAHLVIVLFSSLNYSIYFKFLKIFELAFFAGVQILILVCRTQQDTLTTRSLNTLGAVGVAFLFGIVALSFIRAIYTAYRIYLEYDNTEPENGKRSNVNPQTRNDKYYASENQEKLPTEHQPESA